MLSGRYPALCDHSALNTKQLQETQTAKVIKLDDGSMWEVDDVDTLDTSLWLPASEVVLRSNKIINTDDNESADATAITSREATGNAPSKSGYGIEASADDESS